MKASTVKAKPFPECQHNVPLDTMCKKCWENAEVNQSPRSKRLDERNAVEHPYHYNANPSGIEAILVIEHMNFCLGNAIKYIWRADQKGNPIEDLKKAAWYLDREIKRRENEKV